jgi:hypothetical protein
MPIRAGVHICVGAGGKDVGQQTELLTLSTPTKYIQISHYLKNGPHKRGPFSILPILEKKHKAATFFFKKPFWVWKIYINLKNQYSLPEAIRVTYFLTLFISSTKLLITLACVFLSKS